MANTYKQPGKVLDYVNTTGAAIASGSGVLIGTLVGVALADIPVAATGSTMVCGVHTVTKLGTDVMAQGVKVYWDNTNKRLTTTASGNTEAGRVAVAAGSGETTVQVLLNGLPA